MRTPGGGEDAAGSPTRSPSTSIHAVSWASPGLVSNSPSHSLSVPPPDRPPVTVVPRSSVRESCWGSPGPLTPAPGPGPGRTLLIRDVAPANPGPSERPGGPGGAGAPRIDTCSTVESGRSTR